MRRSSGGWIEALIVFGLVVGCAPDATTSPPATAQATVPDGGQTADPSGTTALDVRGQAGSGVRVAVMDQSASLITARSASLVEIQTHESDFVGRDPIIGRNVNEDTVLVLWTGSSCDTTGRLVIGPGIASIRYMPDPRRGCDAINIVRGVVLNFDRGVVAGGIALSVGPEQIIEE